jgi:hypothetical protein
MLSSHRRRHNPCGLSGLRRRASPPPPEARCRGPHGSRVRRQTPSASLAAGVGHQAPGSCPTEGGGRFPQLLPRRGGANGRSAVASAGQGRRWLKLADMAPSHRRGSRQHVLASARCGAQRWCCFRGQGGPFRCSTPLGRGAVPAS